MGNASQFPVLPSPRFSPVPLRGGVVACLCLWVAATGLSAAPAPSTSPLPASAYWQAMDRFNHEDYTRALDLLDHAPDSNKPGEQADVWNLRGASYLHLHKYDKAREAFQKAVDKDPGLWAARFNLAEVSFRQGKYAESRKQFEELLGRTNRFTHSDERGFLQYKLMLTQALAGDEKPAQTYVDQHRGDRSPALTYYYLQAALEHRHGQDKQAEQWLAQADAHFSPAGEQVFAESFRALGWYTQRSEKLIAAARRRDPSATTTPTSLAVVELLPGQTPAAKTDAAVGAASPAPTDSAAPRPDFRTTAPPAPFFSAENVEAAQMPPADTEANELPNNTPAATADDFVPDDPRAVYSRPVVLARPAGKPKSAPGSTPSASAAPAAASTPDATSSPAAKPSASPAASPKPGFLEKYEQAYVKFLEKNYADARKLLDEADAIQPGQTTSVNLRAQIFKHYYEAAYAAYKQRGDYNETLAQLDEADATQPDQPDALNLRGLTFSKQKDYEHAEAAFKKAIQADPQFWAARFNYAELPFNYRNYTAARSRFEELSAQTDPTRQPKELELTQFKIFLTLLLEGKKDAARSFMGHLAFTGSTPARYFCQAALDFYDGSADKAQEEIKSANKDFPARLVDIFKESFYRIGWLNDPSNPAAGSSTPPTAVAEASPGATPSLAMAAAPSPTLAESTPAPAAAAPTVVAEATPLATPAASASLAPSPRPSVAVAEATPAPAAPAIAPPTPAATPALARTDTPKPAATPAAETRPAKLSKQENLIRLLILGFVAISILWSWVQFLLAVMNRKPQRTAPVTRSPLYANQAPAEEPDEVELPR